MKNVPDMEGKVFGKWTVLRRLENDKHGNSSWLCRCECGEERAVLGARLRSGKSQTCGCTRALSMLQANTTHDGTHHPLYKTWKGMKERCYLESNRSYADYGGRGITVCSTWLEDFWAFVRDMGPRPKGTTLDRVDNAKGYSPENCRWATPEEQNSNRRNNRLVFIDGQYKALSQVAREYGITRKALQHRILKMGLSPERAVTYKSRKAA